MLSTIDALKPHWHLIIVLVSSRNFNKHITSLMTKMGELSQLVEKNQKGKPVGSYNLFAGMLGGQTKQFQEGRGDKNSQRQDTVQIDALYQSIKDLRKEPERAQKQMPGNGNIGDMAVSLQGGETFSSQGGYIGFVLRNSPTSNGCLPPRVVEDVNYLFFLKKRKCSRRQQQIKMSALYSQ